MANMGAGGRISAEEEGAWARVHELITMHCVPMALQAAEKLHVMEILASAPAGQELSASEIVARIKEEYRPSISINPTAHSALDRVLRVLATQGVLSSSLQEELEEGGADGGGGGHVQLPPVRKYGITPVSRYLASGPEGGASLAAIHLMSQHRAFTEAWQLLDRIVLEGGSQDAFTLAHGKSPFLYGQGDPEFAKLFAAGMANFTGLFMPFVLRAYDGFVGVDTLVDVGGGTGACIAAVASKYPHIKAINFDQPHVVASAPSYPGVEHVGGDMFKSIPQADAIFLKYILHNWSDESCVEILKNCYKALPAKNGKVIMVDIVMSPGVETTSKARVQSHLDLLMLGFFKGGKERTQQELQSIANVAGFKRLHLVTQVQESSVVELYKD